MRNIFLFLIVFSTSLTQAYTPEDYEETYFCPSAHSVYKNALNELKELKGKLESLECKSMSLEIDKISALNDDRKSIIDIVSKNEDGVLSASDAQKLQDYTSKATSAAADIVSMAQSAASSGFTGLFDDPCSLDEASRFEVISKASSVVYDATQLASKVAGPYGVPIAIGGSVISGVLKGVSIFMENKSHIDFNNENKRLFYAEALCLYHQSDLEYDQIMNPETQEDVFRTLTSHFTSILNVFDNDCKTRKPFTVSKALESHVLSPEGNLVETSNEVLTCDNRVQNLIEAFNESDYEASDSFLTLQKDAIADLNNYSLRVTDDQEAWGDLVSEALLNLNWAQNEVERFSSILNHPSQGIEKGEVQVLRNKMSDFFKGVANLELMKWYVHEEIPKRVAALNKAFKNIPIFFYNSRVDEQRAAYLPSNQRIFNYIFENYDNIDKSRSYASAVLDAYNDWKALEERFASYKEYCQFFNDSLLITTQTAHYCSNLRYKNIKRAEDMISKSAFYLAFLIQDPSFPKRAARTTFDFSLDEYITAASGLPVRTMTAQNLGAFYFVDGEDDDFYAADSEKEYHIVADTLMLAEPIVASPVIVTESGALYNPCNESSLSWQERLNCQVSEENRSLRNRNQ